MIGMVTGFAPVLLEMRGLVHMVLGQYTQWEYNKTSESKYDAIYLPHKKTFKYSLNNSRGAGVFTEVVAGGLN